MQLTIRLFAALRERAGTDRLELEGLSPPLDVAGLKRELEQRYPALGDLSSVRGVLGTSYVSEDTAVEDGAEVSLLPPVSGGAPGGDPAGDPGDDPDAAEDAALHRGVFEVSAAPLDVLACQRRVSHPSCGAAVVFTGMTRERNRERDVVRLDYEAFAEMAGVEMARVYADCVERFGPGSAAGAPIERRLRMLTQHRTGTVGVGEPSVVIAVASPHRDAAFSACRFLIDELKQRVPLWKKEVYGDGHHWIGERS